MGIKEFKQKANYTSVRKKGIAENIRGKNNRRNIGKRDKQITM